MARRTKLLNYIESHVLTELLLQRPVILINIKKKFKNHCFSWQRKDSDFLEDICTAHGPPLSFLFFILHNALWNMFGASGSIKCTSLKQSGSRGPMNRLKELPSPIWNGARDTLNVFKSQTPCLHPVLALVHRTQTFVIFTVQNSVFSRMLFEIWRCSWPTCRVLEKSQKLL